MRICSLLPSATEIVAELGLVDSLIGISEECDWPPEVRGLPVVSASRVDTSRSTSFEIDEAVRDAVGDGRQLYAIDRELLETLEPDLILTQNLCAVCAVSADNLSELCATDAEVVALDAHTLAEIEGRILSLADLLGASARGRTVVAEMEAKIAAVRRGVAGAPMRSVFVAEWLDPPYAAGHWIPEMVAIAGGRDVLGQAGAPSYPTSWETVQQTRPELVVVAPCGFDHERAASEARLPPLACRAVAVDSNAYYARPAPRLADGIAQLAFLIHPDLVDDPGLPSHPEREARTRKLFNSLFVIGRNGQILRTAAEARPDARQRRLVERRRTRSPIPVDGITVGLLLCADAYRHCRRNACATLVRSCSSHPRRGGRATCQFSDGPIAKCELTESTVLRPQ
jgi:iron complex transport system substrate-binding protein